VDEPDKDSYRKTRVPAARHQTASWEAALVSNRPRRGSALLLVALALAGAACGGQGDGGRPAATTAAAPSTTLAQIGAVCLQGGERSRTVRFRSANGAELAGVLLGKGQVGVVLAHQINNDLCQWLPYARVLAKRGYRVLAFDFEGSGASGPSPGSGDPPLDQDVAAAAELLRERGASRVVLVGGSLGGTAVVTAAAGVRPPVAGVICLSGPSEFYAMDAVRAASRLTVPVLFMVGAQDRGFPENAREMYAATKVPDRKLVVVPGPYHGVVLLDPDDPTTRRNRDLVERWLASHTGS
jgi:pimeloyl-ACP methyl ester carboxylesterase